MAEEPTRRAAPPQPARPRSWRVTPAPDGRGGQQGAAPRPRPNSRWLVVLLVLGLLALNLWISSQALKPNARVRVPYSPTFLSQVQSGNVDEISSTGDAIQGTFKAAVNDPDNDPS